MMSIRRLVALFCVMCGFAGCGEQTAINTSNQGTPEAVASYKTSLCLAAEPTEVVSILDIRTHLAEPSHDADLATSDHDHAGHDHAGHNHAGHNHAGHNHAGHNHADHNHADHNHADHDHADHDGHDHGHANHEGEEHGGHDHAAGDAHHEEAHADHAHAHRDLVVLVGKVGGAPGAERSSAHFPFEKGKASFVMFDPAFEQGHGEGHEHAEGHECHFCQSKAQDAQAIVRFKGKDGKPIPVDARELFDIQEDDVVVVKGMASVQAGMLIVDGDGIFVRK